LRRHNGDWFITLLDCRFEQAQRTLRSGPADRDAINNITDIVERSAKAQLQIIEDLLDSARIVTGKL
jgi:hypothetical protein